MITKKKLMLKSKSYFFTVVFLLISSLVLLQSCEKDDDSEYSNDTEAPSIYILTPTSEDVFVTTEGEIAITGTAQDDMQLKVIKYLTNYGINGDAEGLENWNIPNLSLKEGDNQITITAIDENNNQSEAKITITKNKYLTFLGLPFINNDVFFVNEPTDVWITTSIAPNEKLITSSVKLIEVDENNKFVSEICSLNDDGDLENGDEIRGDNVFSIKHTFNFSNETEKRYRISAKTLENGEEVEGFSAVFTITVIGKQNADLQIEKLINVQQQAETKLSELLNQGLDHNVVIKQLKSWLPTLSNIKDVSENNGWIKITHASGLESYIVVKNDNGQNVAKGGSSTNNERRRVKIPLSQQTRGILDRNTRNISLKSTSSLNDKNIIQNKDVLIWAAFEDEFPQDMEPSLRSIFNNSPVNFNLTYLRNKSCDTKSLQNITKYGIVIFDTHGAGGDLILTREEVGLFADLIGDYVYNLFSSNYKLVTMTSGTYYAITSKFIKNKINGTFPNSVIFNGSCESSQTDLLANAFIGRGAKTYLGFTNIVMTDTCIDKADQFFTNLTGNDLKTTGNSYIQDLYFTQTDGKSTWNCSYTMKGSTEMRFYLGLINGDFEYGNLNGWNVVGDGRIITQLGHQKPTQPYYMGIVSTGLGYTENYGSIHQTFKVTNETTLSLKWNFLSEEFMEYVGSKYQDYLKISITENDNTEVVFYKAIDSFAQQYNLSLVSPTIVFDQGGVYMTGWQTSSFDISKYKGKTITLSIESGDIGDSIYDSATLLDEIKIH